MVTDDMIDAAVDKYIEAMERGDPRFREYEAQAADLIERKYQEDQG